MGLLLKFHCASEQVSSILVSVSQWLNSTGLQKFMATTTVKILVDIFKTIYSIVIELSAVELWSFSQ